MEFRNLEGKPCLPAPFAATKERGGEEGIKGGANRLLGVIGLGWGIDSI
jgi:hypothetical protein